MGLRTHGFIPQTYAFVNTGSIRELWKWRWSADPV
jgi:hypothetical protein